jgi:predicted component of type VI protein secretion system
MGQGEREEGAAMSTTPQQDGEQTRSPEEIRADIEQTREQVGDTVEALAAKTDVKAQARQRLDTVKGSVRAKTDQAKAKVQAATPANAQQGGRQVVTKVRENPAPLAVGGALLAAFLIGRRSGRP